MSALDDLASLVRDDGVVLGAAPAAPYRQAEEAIRDRRARGLFADMRFTMQQPERSCHPETALRGARTVVSALIEVWQPEPPRPDGRRRPPAAVRLGRSLRPAPRVAAAGARRPAGRRRAGGGVRRPQHARRPRRRPRRRASRSRARTRWRSRPASGSFVALGAVITDAALVAGGAGAGARRLRLVHALRRRVPDGRAGRARRARLRRGACRTGRRAAPTRRRRRRRRSRTASTAATSARTCARGTPGPAKRRADAADPGAEAFVSLADWLTAPDDDLRAPLRAALRARPRPALPAPQRPGRPRQRPVGAPRAGATLRRQRRSGAAASRPPRARPAGVGRRTAWGLTPKSPLMGSDPNMEGARKARGSRDAARRGERWHRWRAVRHARTRDDVGAIARAACRRRRARR